MAHIKLVHWSQYRWQGPHRIFSEATVHTTPGSSRPVAAAQHPNPNHPNHPNQACNWCNWCNWCWGLMGWLGHDQSVIRPVIDVIDLIQNRRILNLPIHRNRAGTCPIWPSYLLVLLREKSSKIGWPSARRLEPPRKSSIRCRKGWLTPWDSMATALGFVGPWSHWMALSMRNMAVP